MVMETRSKLGLKAHIKCPEKLVLYNLQKQEVQRLTLVGAKVPVSSLTVNGKGGNLSELDELFIIFCWLQLKCLIIEILVDWTFCSKI